MLFGHVDASGAHVILQHRYTALFLHYPACGRLRYEREGGTVLVIVAALLSILTAVLYRDRLSSLAKENSEQGAQQHCTRTH